MKTIPRFLAAAVPGYEILDVKEWLAEGKIEVFLDRKEGEASLCCRCGSELTTVFRGKHRMRVEGMPILGLRSYFYFWRLKKHCGKWRKARSESVSFLAKETPHLTLDYAWWIGRLCEIAAVTRVAELVERDGMTTWRLDFARMKLMLSHYKIPPVKRISVDDLIGAEACSRIEVVAADQHDDYAASVREFCKNATLVWDQFHIMQNFEKAVNETRKDLHQEQSKGSDIHRRNRRLDLSIRI